jgi:hypothetical protein
MQIEALVCPRCGAPLRRPGGLPTIVECAFCGTALSLTPDDATVSREATPDEVRDNERRDQRVAFSQALAAALRAGRPAFDALRDAATSHLANASDPETLARVAFALAMDFERESGVSVQKDPNVLVRIAEAYMRVFFDLRAAPEAEINLPFLTVNANGPVHFQRKVTPAILASLAARDPHARGGREAPPPVQHVTEERPPKKRGWWPF